MPFIAVRAKSVVSNNNGTYNIEVEGTQEISNEDRATLDRLFPNLTDAAYNLLNRELLLSCLATPAEVDRKPDAPERKHKIKPEYRTKEYPTDLPT